MSQTAQRKLAAILSADVKGYSRLMGEDEVGTLRTLNEYMELMNKLIHRHRGRVVGSAGDSLLAEFPSAVDAVECSVQIQEGLRSRNAQLPANRKMELRIGVNLGDVIVEGEQIYGDGVNIAARLQGLAEGGGVCISGTVYDQIEDKLRLSYGFMGEKMVKNIRKPVRAYCVGRDLDVLRRIRRAELPDRPSIAVLPFNNMSGDPQQDYLSDGITEDLITDISKISSLFVIARNSVFTYKGKAVKVEQVGQELGVRYVLEGSVQKAGDRLRITAQLIDALTGYHIWAERYDRDIKDLFSLQDEVNEKIITTLRVKVEKAEIERVLRKPTESLKAYDYVLRGKAYVHGVYGITKEENARAQEMFRAAIELDPDFAGAYAGLGWAHFQAWVNQWNADLQSLDRIIGLAQKAITLNPSLSSAFRLLGECHLWKRQYEQAIAEIERAIALDPNDADNYAELSSALVWVGRSGEAIGWMEKAMRLNPHYPALYLLGLGLAQYLTEKREEAIATFRTALIHSPHFLGAHILLAVIFGESGRMDEARAEVLEVLRINPDYSLQSLKEMIPFKDQTFLEKSIEILRKSGLR